MRYPLKCLQRAGLVSTLLIGGVMGGLMAPLPSEATQPSVKIKIDTTSPGGVETELITETQDQALANCTQSEKDAGYNYCYRLKIRPDLTQPPSGNNPPFEVTGKNGSDQGAGTTRKWVLLDATTPSGSKASLLVVDKDGTNKSALTGLRVEPKLFATALGWGCTTKPTICQNVQDTHVVYITSKVYFDILPDNRTSIEGALLTSGKFYPGPTGSSGWDVIGDTIILSATGVFRSGTTKPMTTGFNYNEVSATGTKAKSGDLTFQFGGPANGDAWYQLFQIQGNYDNDTNTPNSYPLYTPCDNGNGKCAYQKTEVYTVTVKGPDALELQSSNDWVDTGCDITNNKGGQTPQGPPCFSNSKKFDATDPIAAASTTIIATSTTNGNANGGKVGESCEANNNCQCTNPYICKGNIVIAVRVNPDEAVTQNGGFPFSAEGPGIALPGDQYYPLYFSIPTLSNGTGSRSFPDLFVGDTTAPWSFNALVVNNTNWPVPDSTHKYDPDGLGCESLLNQPAITNPDGTITPAVIVSTWTVSSGSLKTNATVTKLGAGDTVTCTFTIHKKSINSN